MLSVLYFEANLPVTFSQNCIVEVHILYIFLFFYAQEFEE